MDRNKILTNFSWRFAERVGAQMVSAVVSIILARLLDPEVYGLTAIVYVFSAILNVFIDSGFGNALIQKKDADDLDFSTVFYFNIVICLTLYIGMFLGAPYIARAYSNFDANTLIPVIRVMSLSLLLSGVSNVLAAYVSRTMQFKRFFFATSFGTIGAAVVGIGMALKGYGVWALVAQGLFNGTLDTVILWCTVDWRPKRMFSFKRLKGLFSFGWKLLCSSLLDTLYNNLSQLIIGKVYSSSDLAFYNKGKMFPNLIIQNVNTSMNSVLLPSLSAVQDDKERLKAMTRRAMKTSTYVMAPFLIGLAVLAPAIIQVILTDKWLPVVFFMRIYCVIFLFHPIHTANLNALKALGRSDLFLKLEIVKKLLGIAALFVTVPIGVEAMAYSLLFTSITSQIINSWPNKKLLNYGYLEQMKDILPGIILAVTMGFCIYPIQRLNLPGIITLLVQVFMGAVIYIAGSIVFKLDSFQYLWETVKPILMKVGKK